MTVTLSPATAKHPGGLVAVEDCMRLLAGLLVVTKELFIFLLAPHSRRNALAVWAELTWSRSNPSHYKPYNG